MFYQLLKMRKVISLNFPAKYRNLQFYTKRHKQWHCEYCGSDF